MPWCRLLARDHAAPESTLALSKAHQPCCGRVRPLAWCSRPRSSTVSLEGALGARAQPGDAELVGELARACSDDGAQLLGLEQHSLAPLGEHLAEEPLLAADGHFGERRTVLEQGRAALGRPTCGDAFHVEDLRGAGVAESPWLEGRTRIETLLRELRAAHPVEPEAALSVARAVPCMDPPVRQLALERVRFDDSLRPGLLALLLVLDLDQPALADPLGEGGNEIGLGVGDLRVRRLRQLELAEGLLELPTDAIERSMRVGGDHRSDELQCEPDRARLEWCQPRRPPERVSVQLLVDVDDVAVERRIHRVTAAAEVDEVEQLQMVLQLFLGDVKALDDLVRRDDRVVSLAAGCEEIG